MRQKTRALVSAGTYWIPDCIHPAVFQTAPGTAGTVGLDKTIGILPVSPTIGTASRHNHDGRSHVRSAMRIVERQWRSSIPSPAKLQQVSLFRLSRSRGRPLRAQIFRRQTFRILRLSC
jgi:hypothetical protein